MFSDNDSAIPLAVAAEDFGLCRRTLGARALLGYAW